MARFDGKPRFRRSASARRYQKKASAGRYFAAGENFGQLFCAAGRVFGRDHLHENLFSPAVTSRSAAIASGLLSSMPISTCSGSRRCIRIRMPVRISGMLLHQTVICRDIGLTFRRIDNQGADKITAAFQLAGGRKPAPPRPAIPPDECGQSVLFWRER